MSSETSVLIVITFIGATVNGALGYGFSSITVPVALLFLTNRVLNPVLVLIEVALNAYVLFVNRRALPGVWRRVLPIVVGLSPGIVIGTLLVSRANPAWLKFCTFLTLLPLILLQAAGYRRPIRSERSAGLAFGGGLGVLYSVTTISGPPLAVMLNNQGLTKHDFRAALGFIRLVESSLTAVAYAYAGLYTRDSFGLIPWIVPSLAVGVPLGVWIIHRVRAEAFRRICMSFDAWIVAFGVSTLLRQLGIVESGSAYLVLVAVALIDAWMLARFFSAPAEHAVRAVQVSDPPSPDTSGSTARAPRFDHLRALEAESIHTMREVVAEFERPVMLYSIGKDSSVLLRLAQKAFHPGPIPFPLLHVDTTYKFREMIGFRDRQADQIGARLIVHTNQEAIAEGAQPFLLGTQRCCALLKTKALLDALQMGSFDAAFGGARRDEERSRAKERIFSVRDAKGQWDPKNQRPELWNLLNSRIRPGESIRVFPLSNWTELDVWQYIDIEQIPIVPLYFAKGRDVIVRGDALILLEQPFVPLLPGERPERVLCRMRSLGCSPCTGAVRSNADTVPKIIEELVATRQSERQLRVIDHDQDGSMELKKCEGYF